MAGGRHPRFGQQAPKLLQAFQMYGKLGYLKDFGSAKRRFKQRVICRCLAFSRTRAVPTLSRRSVEYRSEALLLLGR